MSNRSHLSGPLLGKVGLRLLPFLFLLYVVNILDRINVGFAKLQMQDALRLSDDAFGQGMGIFYIGYILFEVPSNLILQRTGARIWIFRIMVSWGLVSGAMMFVRDVERFYALRFLLGVAEAGFFPGIILYLSYWFPMRDRARAVALFMMASPVAGLVGNPVSGAVLQYLDHKAGLAGWQWLFLLEGLPSVLLGAMVWLYLDDGPERARWLTDEEKVSLLTRLRQEEKQREESHGLSRLRALADRRVWLLIAIYFTVAVGSNAFGFYLPTFLNDHFVGREKFEIGLLGAVPSIGAVLAMLLIGTHSDRTGERRRHVAGSALLAAVGWGMTVYFDEPELFLVGLVCAHAGMMAMLPTFWALATSFLSGTAAVGGIALINSLANLGGYLGPKAIGKLRDVTGDDTVGMVLMTVTMLAGGFLALCVRHHPRQERM
jgi:MFS transporter, ACS family, tartrate transporter